MRGPLNLASRPIRNERLPAVLFALATFVLIGATIHHGVILRRLWPTRSAALKTEIEDLSREMKNLESGPMKRAAIPGPQNAEWRVIRDLVDQRAFWWSELFAAFETVLPPDVRITTLTPRVHERAYEVELVVRLANPQAGLGFVKMLEDRPEFENVYPRDCSEMQGEYECRYVMRYLGREPTPTPPSAGLSSLPPPANGGRK